MASQFFRFKSTLNGVGRVFLKGVNNWDEHSSMGHKMALSVAMSSKLMCLSTRLHTLCPNATASCSGTRPAEHMLGVCGACKFMQRQIWLTPSGWLCKHMISYPWEGPTQFHLCLSPCHLPVFTWYLSVVAQSSISCCSGSARSGTSKSSRRFISSGWWKSSTFSFRSLVALTKSKSTSITFNRNSRVSAPAVTVVGKRSG